MEVVVARGVVACLVEEDDLEVENHLRGEFLLYSHHGYSGGGSMDTLAQTPLGRCLLTSVLRCTS